MWILSTSMQMTGGMNVAGALIRDTIRAMIGGTG